MLNSNLLRKLDMQDLMVFIAVYDQSSVTEVSETLFVSQSTVSYSLKKLRTSFEDELFINTRAGMRPTHKATTMYGHVQKILESINLCHAGGQAFDPTQKAVTFNVCAPEYFEQLILPRLGEAVEPVQVERVTPWWRAVDQVDLGVIHRVLPIRQDARAGGPGRQIGDACRIGRDQRRHARPGRLRKEMRVGRPSHGVDLAHPATRPQHRDPDFGHASPDSAVCGKMEPSRQIVEPSKSVNARDAMPALPRRSRGWQGLCPSIARFGRGRRGVCDCVPQPNPHDRAQAPTQEPQHIAATDCWTK